MIRYLVFTDLDGTLLDHHTYSWAPAKPALRRLRETATPLVMVSSKTRTELEAIRTELENEDPFISENGGAIFIPVGYDLDVPEDAREMVDYRVILLGRPSSEIRTAFDLLALKLPVRALSSMSTEEIANLTGLSLIQAEGARNREFGEAFILDDPGVSASQLEREVRCLGLRLTRGGRLWHLLGENDKGLAVSILTELYRRKYPGLVTAGCGDAPNDAPMLAVVDRPFLVARPNGSHEALEVPHVIRVPLPGPAGFNQAVLSLLGEWGIKA
jgi:mannosyl-3-phosphoglycerate phosphatase